jgi:hypothetical protein
MDEHLVENGTHPGKKKQKMILLSKILLQNTGNAPKKCSMMLLMISGA